MGANLKKLRLAHGFSQSKLCTRLNIRVSVLIQLRKIYGCTYDDFFAGLDLEENNQE